MRRDQLMEPDFLSELLLLVIAAVLLGLVRLSTAQIYTRGLSWPHDENLQRSASARPHQPWRTVMSVNAQPWLNTFRLVSLRIMLIVIIDARLDFCFSLLG